MAAHPENEGVAKPPSSESGEVEDMDTGSPKPPEAGGEPERMDQGEDNPQQEAVPPQAEATEAPKPQTNEEGDCGNLDEEIETLTQIKVDLNNSPQWEERSEVLKKSLLARTKRSQEGGQRSQGESNKSDISPTMNKHKPWVSKTPRNWGEQQGDIRFKTPKLYPNDGSELTKTSAGANPKTREKTEGGKDKTSKTNKAGSSGMFVLAKKVKGTKHQAKSKEKVGANLEKAAPKKHAPKEKVSPKEATNSGNVVKKAKAKGKDDGVAGVPESQAEGVEGDGLQQEEEAVKRKVKGWKTFSTKEEEEKFLAGKKELARRKRLRLKENQRARTEPSTVESEKLSKTKGKKKSKEESKTLKPKKKDKRRSDSKSKSKGAPPQGKRAGDVASFAPVPKKLRGQPVDKSDVEKQLTDWLEGVNDAVLAEPPQARAGLLLRHGPRTVTQLAAMATLTYQGQGRDEVSWTDSSYQPYSVNLFANGRLRYYRLDASSQGNIESIDNMPAEEIRNAFLTPGSQVFHSSYLVDLERAIDQGESYNCPQCRDLHPPTRTPTTLLLTENEQVATFRSPHNVSLADEEASTIPRAGPTTHCDILYIPKGLSAGIMKVFEAVYGQHKEQMNVILDIGGDAIRNGETVSSVIKQARSIARAIIGSRPRVFREMTRILIPSQLSSKDGRKVVLNSWDESEQDMATELRLHELNLHTRILNVKLGHMEGDKDQDAAVRWDTVIYKESVHKVADAGGRMMEKVSLKNTYGGIVDHNDRLHPAKEFLFCKVLDTIAYVNEDMDSAKWSFHNFI